MSWFEEVKRRILEVYEAYKDEDDPFMLILDEDENGDPIYYIGDYQVSRKEAADYAYLYDIYLAELIKPLM